MGEALSPSLLSRIIGLVRDVAAIPPQRVGGEPFNKEATLRIPEEAIRHWKVLDEIASQTDRGTAIIATAYLDERLKEVILAKLSQSGLDMKFQEKTVRDRLLGGSGPLQSFSARIDFAAALGFLGPQAHRDAHLIRKIRNDFAHKSTPFPSKTRQLSVVAPSCGSRNTLNR